MRRLLILLCAGTIVVAPACRHTAPTRTTLSEPAPSRLLGGGRYDVSPRGTRPGEPFDIETMTVSFEVRNNTGRALVPQCAIWYGSQVALVDTGDKVIEPRKPVWVTGSAEFLRPLDDYESGDAGCFTRLSAETRREIEREKWAMTVGRPTEVPDLIGQRLNSKLPNFRRGLDIQIESETTPCGKKKLMKMSRYVNPFGKPPCGDPRIVRQVPAPGTKAEVGDTISVTVSSVHL